MSDRIFVATRKGLMTVDRTGGPGGPWEVTGAEFVGDPVSIVTQVDGTDLVYAALDLGHFGVKLHRSRDGGNTWAECAAPAFPEKPDGVTDIDPIRGEDVPWTTKLIWALESGRTPDSGHLWCGTIPGGLFKSEDGGDSWSLVRSLWDNPKRSEWFGGGTDLPGIHSVVVDPRDPKHVTIGISCGGVWSTFDGGNSWATRANGMFAEYMPPEKRNDPNIQDPHRLAQCESSPDSMWAQHHNGVFLTTDGGDNWREVPNVKPSVFGFAVAVHPADPETAWFVPAVKDEKRYPADGQVVVARTRDGGETFDVLQNGLPQKRAYDLVYRHSLDVDKSGNRLAFGSTTGSLWVTEDQGDSWTHVTGHLPPIYCVRFVK